MIPAIPTTPGELRKFGLIVGGVFAAIGVWPAVVRGAAPHAWLLGLAAILVVPALVAPPILAPIYRVWMALASVLAYVNTRILLGLVFFGMITPLGLVLRRTRRDPMLRAFDPNAPTYRVPRTPRPGTHMRRQF
jgi:hypothetical protein